MKLLMITRKVDENDSSPAGFTYSWVKENETINRCFEGNLFR